MQRQFKCVTSITKTARAYTTNIRTCQLWHQYVGQQNKTTLEKANALPRQDSFPQQIRYRGTRLERLDAPVCKNEARSSLTQGELPLLAATGEVTA